MSWKINSENLKVGNKGFIVLLLILFILRIVVLVFPLIIVLFWYYSTKIIKKNKINNKSKFKLINTLIEKSNLV